MNPMIGQVSNFFRKIGWIKLISFAAIRPLSFLLILISSSGLLAPPANSQTLSLADKSKADELNANSKKYWYTNYDSSVFFAEKAQALSQSLNYKKGIAESYRNIGMASMIYGKVEVATKPMLLALKLFAAIPDSNGMAATCNNLGVLYSRKTDFGTSLNYFDSALVLFRNMGKKEGEGSVLNYIGINYQEQGNYQKAIDYCLQGYEIRKQINDKLGVVYSLLNVGNMYLEVGQPQSALRFYDQGMSYALDNKIDPPDYLFNQIGRTYLKLKAYDTAESYLVRTNNGKPRQFSDYAATGELYAETGRLDSAILLFNISLQQAGENIYNLKAISLTGLSKVYYEKKNYGLAMTYAQHAYDTSLLAKNKLVIADAANMLAALYKTKGDYKKSIDFFELSHSISDSISSENYQQKLAFAETKNEIENKQASIKLLSAEKNLQVQKIKNQKFRQWLILSILVVSIVLSFYIIRMMNNKRKKIESQKDEIDRQRVNLEKSFAELKSTQAQLIQKEKMSSLGELTSGIAHEIQNPLNFVNNFSELSNELIDEMNAHLNKGETSEAQVIANDIRHNLEKINTHGRRADTIVKAMLEHSRSSSGISQETDVNAMAEEYTRIAYNSYVIKNPFFEASIRTNFDPAVPKIDIIPQDIGRVLLNILNNAFYAVNEKKNNLSGSELIGFQPLVSVTTRKTGGHIEIRVRDNGSGIPQNILDKLFQPFFTTKPSGQGTGLGLSLSYDILKSMGGSIKVESVQGAYAEFIVILPVNPFARSNS